MTSPGSVTFGLLLPSREFGMYPPHDGDPRRLVDLAVRAEQAGFDAAWIGDSLLAKPRAEPLSVLAAAALVTERIDLGTAVLLAAMRPAAQLAQQAATIDALSGGRLILGVGAGPGLPQVRDDFDLVGAEFDRRGGRMMQVVHDARKLWQATDTPADLRLQPVCATEGGPRMWLGGSGPRGLERAGRHFDGWFPTAPVVDNFAGQLATVRAAAADAGRDPAAITAAAYLTVNIGEPATAAAEVAEHSMLYYGVEIAVLEKIMGTKSGTAAEVGIWLQSYIDAGCEHLCIRLASPDVDTQLDRLLELLPQLRT
ncbi:LLM class flavin-dependent oxidoreductase [Candidatus Poriferisodalis sp.]|uniref:LLM class flavin-dependent oxidoreductase n=1 Tax=Candidatus Poriferisodalis sp. TaxID=3101277 RepID=UPI003C6FD38E